MKITGKKGHGVVKTGGKYVVTFKVNKKFHRHGKYDTFEEAKYVADLIKQEGLFERPKDAVFVNNTSGVRGVDYHKSSRKWRARYGKTTLGFFDTIEEATEARKKAEPNEHIS